MNSFFKMFFASLLAIIVFSLIGVFFFVAAIAALGSKEKTEIASGSVLVLDLAQRFPERREEAALGALTGEAAPGVYDVIRMLEQAKEDKKIAGVLIQANGNANGFATSNELRASLQSFRQSGKFVLAYGDVMQEQAYFVASAAEKIYVHPAGDFAWTGMQVTFPFVKGMLDKLQIRPQIFYAGKFKSATEIFRTEQMTPENRLQTTEWLGDIYQYFLQQTDVSRKLDSAQLRQLAVTAAIRTPQDALANRLIDGLKYDDEVKDELKRRLNLGKRDNLNLVSMKTYADAVSLRKSGSDRIALIYAEGDIVDGEGEENNIGGDRYRALIRKARLDKSVRAIVLRVNSGGGSALASETIWRELEVARQDGKPVIVSFGDVAASGGYYIACGADSIFASPNTITGSIGVFGVIPDMQDFFRNKLGVTFDAVKTAPYADAGTVTRPLNEGERRIIQNSIDRIYAQFKQRVAQGRRRDTAYIDSIAQGRVWSGADALRLGLVDRIGGLQQAIASAARLAKLNDYGIKEYPESRGWLANLLQRKKEEPAAMIREQIGEEQYQVFLQLVKIRRMTQSVQARLPFDYQVVR
jgi:protease-4